MSIRRSRTHTPELTPVCACEQNGRVEVIPQNLQVNEFATIFNS